MEPHGDYWKIILDQHLIERKVLHMIDKIKDEDLASECLEIFQNYSQIFEIEIADNFEELREMILSDQYSMGIRKCAFSFLIQVSNIDELETKKAVDKAIRHIDSNKDVYLTVCRIFSMEETWENGWYLGLPIPWSVAVRHGVNVLKEKIGLKQPKKYLLPSVVAGKVRPEFALSVFIASVIVYLRRKQVKSIMKTFDSEIHEFEWQD